MHPVFLALALFSGPPADVPISVPFPIVRQVRAAFDLLAVARADPTQDALAAYDAARAALVALRDELLRDAAEKMRQAAAITAKLGGAVPPPPPGPDPPPAPVLTPLATKARDLVGQKVEAYNGRVMASKRLANAIRDVLSSAPTDPAILKTSLRDALVSTLGPDLNKWKPWSAALGAYLDAEQVAQRVSLTTAGGIVDAWGQVASGLAAYKE